MRCAAYLHVSVVVAMISACGGAPDDGPGAAQPGGDGGNGMGAGNPTGGSGTATDGTGGAGTSSGGASTSSGGAGMASGGAGSAEPTCAPGTSEVDWPTDCPTGPTRTCVGGDFIIFNPTGNQAMPDVQQQSAHFALRWEGNLVGAQQAATALSILEEAWDEFVDGHVGFTEPFCDSATKYKVNVHVRPDGGYTGSGVQNVPAMWIQVNGITNRWILAHEFAHGLQYSSGGLRDSIYVGWTWESHANWMAHQLSVHRGDVGCANSAEGLVNFPHIYYGSTRNRYCNWHFWEYLKDKYCYQAVNDIWDKAPTDSSRTSEDPFSVLARNMGWSANELNDVFGQWAMHNVTWDYRDPDGTDQGAVYRALFSYSGSGLTGGNPEGTRRLRVTRLEELDPENGRYAVPHAWAPQRWGYNLVRLHPQVEGATTVTVTFRGVLQDAPANTNFSPYTETPNSMPDPDSDWRWGVVAVAQDGAPRYSELQRGADGALCFEVQQDDVELWLVVVGTPSTIHKVRWDQKYFSVYRYPWMVQLEGAVPDGYQPDAPTPTPNGDYHSNGGGWVAAGATVAESAYVGPHAAVLGGSVSGQARIEDHAIVMNAAVSGNAVVSGLSLLGGGIQVGGDARVGTVFRVLNGNHSITGTAQVYGDVELSGTLNASSGVYYGFIEPGHTNASQHGADQTTPPIEVTAQGPYSWRP